MAEPQGMVMLLLWPDGTVLAEVTDFAPDRPSGFTVQEAQRLRCERRLGRAAIDRLANPILGEAMGSYHIEETIRSMTRNHGFRIHEVAIGHDEADGKAAR